MRKPAGDHPPRSSGRGASLTYRRARAVGRHPPVTSSYRLKRRAEPLLQNPLRPWHDQPGHHRGHTKTQSRGPQQEMGVLDERDHQHIEDEDRRDDRAQIHQPQRHLEEAEPDPMTPPPRYPGRLAAALSISIAQAWNSLSRPGSTRYAAVTVTGSLSTPAATPFRTMTFALSTVPICVNCQLPVRSTRRDDTKCSTPCDREQWNAQQRT